MQLKLHTGNGVWIFKFSMGNYEALSSASQREVCNRSSTDYWCQIPGEPFLDSSQIFPRAEKRAACSASKNKCLLSGDEFKNSYTLMTIETIREKMIFQNIQRPASLPTAYQFAFNLPTSKQRFIVIKDKGEQQNALFYSKSLKRFSLSLMPFPKVAQLVSKGFSRTLWQF